MKTIDLFLSDKVKYDVIIEHKVNLSIIKETFCFDCNCSKANQQNVLNNKISLFTFENEMIEQNLANIHLNTQHNIANDFLSYVSQCKYKTKNYKAHIKNHAQIKKYIDTKYNEKIKDDMRILKKEASVIRSDNNVKNVTCCRLLLKLMEQCRERFTDVDDTVRSIPLIKNDTINYFYTITAGTISRTYLIKLLLV
jgi:hypothetical protein